MRLNTLVSFIGFIVVAAATYCPVLRPFNLVNWNVYDGNKPYGIVILLVAVVGVLGSVFNELRIVRICAWLSLALVIIFYILAWLKIHTSFSFIPFHSLDVYLSRQIKFKWGWYLLITGPIFALAGVYIQQNKKMLNANR